MKKIMTAIAACAMWICAFAQYDIPYKVIAPISGANDGDTAYMINFDNGEKMDSAVVSHGAAVFGGEISEPCVARIIVNGNRYCTFILEEGTAAINQTKRRAVGTMLNDMYNEYADSIAALEAKVEAAATTAERDAAFSQLISAMEQMTVDNLDSPIGYLIFIDLSNYMDVKDMLAFIDQNPDLKGYVRVQKLIEGSKRKLATSAGQPFVDFAVEYNGVTKKLSDYVGNGHYTLVDFWASWCGPCVREIKTLKEINAEYADKGLQVLGVAVWDEPENTLAAIDRLQIPWECIINSQNIATDAYGIPAIPCIILFDPQGNIVFRDLQGEALKEAVAAAIE